MRRRESTEARPPALAARRVGPLKVPATIGVLFWVVKVLTTGLGEAASDWLAGGDLILAGALGAAALVGALAWQLRTPRYRPGVYWLAVAMVAVFGTMAADGVHVVLGVGYPVSTALSALLLAVVFTIWRRREGSCSIHLVDSPSRELCYWATVLVTFALGTAAGDWTAFSLGLGYLGSATLFAGAIAVPALLWRAGLLPPTLAFWSAYVLTRPLGASLADWIGKPADHGGGLGVGDGAVALGAAVLVVALVTVMTVMPSGARDRGASDIRP